MIGAGPDKAELDARAERRAKAATGEGLDCRESAYARQVNVAKCNAMCDVCKVAGDCIAIDTSDEEYGAGFVCKQCIMEILK